MAMVILGMAAAGVLLPFSSGATMQTEGMRRTLAAKLANDLMERIVVTTPANIIATWNGYSEAEGEVTDASSNFITAFTDPMYTGFSRSVVCSTVGLAVTSGVVKFVLIKVTVAWQGREIVTLSSWVNL
jgi:hypothetical protein